MNGAVFCVALSGKLRESVEDGQLDKQFVHRDGDRRLVSKFLSDQGGAGMLIKATVLRDSLSRREEPPERKPGIVVAFERTRRRPYKPREQSVRDLALVEPSAADDHVSRPNEIAGAFASSLRNTAAILESCLLSEERLFYARHPEGFCNSMAARSMRRRLQNLQRTIARLELS